MDQTRIAERLTNNIMQKAAKDGDDSVWRKQVRQVGEHMYQWYTKIDLTPIQQIAHQARLLQNTAKGGKWKVLGKKAKAIQKACEDCEKLIFDEIGGSWNKGKGIKSIDDDDLK